jgi:2-phospho-L-lactate guanylyltransferase
MQIGTRPPRDLFPSTLVFVPTVAIIPVKSFAFGKQRLSSSLDPDVRARLARTLADHVASTAAAAGLMPLIVTADGHVAEWATRTGFPSVVDPGEGLDAAAATGVDWAEASGSHWVILHADLPLVDVSDIVALDNRLATGPVIAPSADGGTSAIGGRGPVQFSFGDASFHRHLSSLPGAQIVVRPGLLLDVDSPVDLRAAMSAPGGDWIRDLVYGTRPGSGSQILY